MGVISFIAKSTLAAGNTSPHSQNYMGSILANDLLILAVFTDQEFGGTPGSISTPAGWTLANGGVGYRDNVPTNIGSIAVFYKIADGTETGSVSITIGGSTGGSNVFISQMYQYRGDVGPILESSAANILGDGDTTIDVDAVGVGGNARTLIAIIGQRNSDPGTPTGYTNRAVDDSGGTIFLQCDDKENVGSDGAVTATGGDAEGWATVHMSFFTPLGRSFIPQH